MSAIVTESSIYIITCLIAIVAGALIMSLSAYFTTRTEGEHFNEDVETKDLKERKFLSDLGIGKDIQDIASEEIKKENDQWSNFIEQAQDGEKTMRNAASVMIAYLAGGMVPVLPFLVTNDLPTALTISAIITFVFLLIMGFIKSRINKVKPWGTIIRLLMYTALAAACAYWVAGLIAA